MVSDIKKQDEVWTADGKKLGTARQLFHRTEGANPELRLYETYLEVEDFDYGANFYVPTDFITERQAETRRVLLSKKRDEAMKLTWFRMPEFVAQGKSQKETLPD